MATREAVIQALTQMLAAHQAQTLEMMGGLQRQLQEAMQGMMVGIERRRKGEYGTGQSCKPIGRSWACISAPDLGDERNNRSFD